jgi:hypothetical protein
MFRGLWVRYTPVDRPPLDFVAAHLFWAGLVIAAFRWRRTYGWFTFFVPLFVPQVFSRGTPDLARAIVFAPFYFLFIGMTFDELLSAVKRMPARAVVYAAIAAAMLWVSITNVRDYFQWQERVGTQAGRLPAIDVCEFAEYSAMARTAARERTTLSAEAIEELRDRLNCSKVIQQIERDQPEDPGEDAPSAIPPATPVRIPTLTPVPEATTVP